MTFLKYIFRFRIVTLIVFAPIIIGVIHLLDYLIGPERLHTLFNLIAIGTWLIFAIVILLWILWILSKIREHKASKQEKQQFTETLTRRRKKR